MGCNCKNDEVEINEDEKINLFKTISKYVFRTIVFLFSLILLPIIVVVTIWLMFELLVLSKDFDTKGVMLKITSLIKGKDYDDDDDDDDEYYDDYEDDDYEMVDVDVITKETK